MSPPPFECQGRPSQRSSLRPSIAFRPRLEALDARVMPANLAWTNATGDALFATAGNWQNIDTNMVATANPVAGDNLYFDGDVSNANCFNMGAAMPGSPYNPPPPVSTGNPPPPVSTGESPPPMSPPPMSPPSPSPFSEYASVHLIDGYAGTVFTSGFRTATLDLESGAISQTAENADLTVSQLFNWTGGVLNSSAITSTINIQGNGTIAPPNAGTLITGSTLNFIGTPAAQATTNIMPGVLQLKNLASLQIGWSLLKVERLVTETAPGQLIGVDKSGSTRILINEGGTFEVYGIGEWSTDMTVINNGGLFKLNGAITATLSGGKDGVGQMPGTADYGNLANTAAKLHITSGSTLIATHGVVIEGGSVFLIPNPNMPVDQTATIQANFILRGGDIVFAFPIMIGNQLSYGKFTVNGDVRWSGGRYLPTIDCSQAGAAAGTANLWNITGTLTTVAPAAGQTGPSIVPNPQQIPAGQQIPVDKYWQIVQAGKITGPTPTFPQGWNSESIVDNNTNNVVGWRIKR